MLTQINIQHFITIEHCMIDLGHGLITITGDTGSGKSMLIQAIHFALGAKSTLSTKEHHTPYVSLVFDITSCPEAQNQLKEAGIPYEENTCILSRTLSENKKSLYRINNLPCTRLQAQTLGSCLIHVHGQHATFALLKHHQQRAMLDQMIDPALLQKTHLHYQQWKTYQSQWQDAKQKQEQHANQSALLRYQLDELSEVNCKQAHTRSIEDTLKRMNQADEIIDLCERVNHQLKGDEHKALIPQTEALSHAIIKQLATLPEAQEAALLLEQSATLMSEAQTLLMDIHSQTEVNPGALQALDEELSTLHQLARKHQVKLDELEATEQQLHKALSHLEHDDQQLAALEQKVEHEAKAYQKVAQQLSQARSKAIPLLEKKVMQHMKALNFLQAKICIELHTDSSQMSKDGYDQINFLIATNPGHEPGPLNKIASGGELSRISLALQLSLMADHDHATLIFDEVDVGISGKTAAMVGEQLRGLGRCRQVLCITHLAQVAAQGTQHLQVSKNACRDKTITQIKTLNASERIEAIANIIGGIELDQSSIQHAKQLLNHHATETA